MKQWILKSMTALGMVALVGGAAGWYWGRGTTPSASFQTASLTRGPLLITIDASGTLEPEEVVDVGAQVGGRILSLGNDVNGQSVDYGSVVKQDAVLATIDDALYQADAAQAEAQVASEKANVQRAQADLEQYKAKLFQATRDWERAQKLGSSEALAQASYDGYEAAWRAAKANVAVGEAAILQAQAGLTQAEKSVWRANRNVGYCTITSPVSGMIIDRRVNVGQTVVSSMSAPSLFLIARDLKRMRVWVAVNEADISRIYEGQTATFTVDAVPGETFHGEVVKIRPNASMTQNVVTYTVEVATDNSAGRLRPYLTANIRFEVDRRDSALLVPVAALQWKPMQDEVAPEYRSQPLPTLTTTLLPTATSRPTSRPATAATSAVVWVAQGAYVRPVPVVAGISDGTNTEVAGEDLPDSLQVVTGVETTAPAVGTSSTTPAATGQSPFAPNLPKPPKGGGPPH
jgi:HlyD family secretion protein